ncbi:hypothetical protein RyT2_15350 [Pseudolactococcus yaeyamensis]
MEKLVKTFNNNNFKELTTEELIATTGGATKPKNPGGSVWNAIGVIFNTLTGN